MNLQHLRYFMAVAEQHSFTRAAQALRLSLPALSHQVRLLEEQLSAQLFKRTTRKIQLTAQGTYLFAHARKIFDIEAQAERGLLNHDSTLRGTLEIGLSDNLSIHFVPRFLKGLLRKHPSLNFRVFSGTFPQINRELQERRIELGFFYTKPTSRDPIAFEVLGETEFWVVCSPKLLRSTKVSLSQLKRSGAPRIESIHRDYADGFPAHFWSHKLGFQSAPRVEINSHESKKALIEQGMGYGLLIRESVQRSVSRGVLVRVASPKPLKASIYMGHLRSTTPSLAAQHFRNAFRRFLNDKIE